MQELVKTAFEMNKSQSEEESEKEQETNVEALVLSSEEESLI